MAVIWLTDMRMPYFHWENNRTSGEGLPDPCSRTVRLCAALETPPTVTTTGWAPVGVLPAIVKFTCVTPTSQGFPMKVTSAGTPPTVTVTLPRGFGSWAKGVSGGGGAPLSIIGVSS